VPDVGDEAPLIDAADANLAPRERAAHPLRRQLELRVLAMAQKRGLVQHRVAQPRRSRRGRFVLPRMHEGAVHLQAEQPLGATEGSVTSSMLISLRSCIASRFASRKAL